MSRQDVATLAGVPLDRVQPATADELRRAYADSQSATVVEVATQQGAAYWRIGTRYYLDDPLFGDVVAIDDLRYSEEIGLHYKGMSA